MRIAAVFLLGAALAPAAAAQQGAARTRPSSSCTIYIDSTGGDTRFGLENGMRTIFTGGGVWARCLNSPTTIYGDSMAYSQASGQVQFIGRVHFRDSTGLLDADKVTYWSRIERLYAEGNVYTRNYQNGTELRGPNMDFYRVAAQVRDTQELYATGRPIIRFVPANDSVRADTANPFIIIAERVRLKHTDRMWASGHVVINRPDLDATADSAVLSLGDSVGHLIGSPVINGFDSSRVKVTPVPMFRVDTVRAGRRVRIDTTRTVDIPPRPDTAIAYRLTGQRVRFDLTHGQKIKRVLSMGMADARGPDWHLTSDTLDMGIDSGRIQRAQAWGTERRASAVSGLNTVEADSLDIQMPGQVMRQVWAYGRSRATSKADSTWAEDDWLSGDSLRASFAPVDTAGRRRSVIEQVIAFGTARAYYHTENQHDPRGERGINYSRGDKINIAMRDGKVRTVDIVGQVDGVYLEPLAPGDTVPDSLKTDSTRADTTGGPGHGGTGAPNRQPPTTPGAPAPRPSSTPAFIGAPVPRSPRASPFGGGRP